MAIRGTVLVGVDGSDPSLTALRWAARYARQTSSVLRAVWAWHPPSSNGLGLGFDYLPSEAYEMPADAQQKVWGYVMHALVDVDAYFDVEVEAVVRVGKLDQILLEESEGCALVVVGRQGGGGFAGVLASAVRRSVSTHAIVPVVVVPHSHS